MIPIWYGVFGRVIVRPDGGLRSACESLRMLDLEQICKDLFGLSPLAVQARHAEAFDYRELFQKPDEALVLFKNIP